MENQCRASVVESLQGSIRQKRGITPAILPSLIHRLDSGKSRLGQTDPEGDDHQQKSDATSGRVQSRTRFQE